MPPALPFRLNYSTCLVSNYNYSLPILCISVTNTNLVSCQPSETRKDRSPFTFNLLGTPSTLPNPPPLNPPILWPFSRAFFGSMRKFFRSTKTPTLALFPHLLLSTLIYLHHLFFSVAQRILYLFFSLRCVILRYIFERLFKRIERVMSLTPR